MDSFFVEVGSTFGRLKTGALFVPFSRKGRPDSVNPNEVLCKLSRSTEVQTDPERSRPEVHYYVGGRAQFNPASTTKVWKVACRYGRVRRIRKKD